jgi:GNAT superfamily N-acetyltransferase
MHRVRPAVEADAPAIHEAHMRSIREVCAKDYTDVEIAAWGGRAFMPELRTRNIREDCVWVAERDGKVCGYGHLKRSGRGPDWAEVLGLYIAPEGLGLGMGAGLMDALLKQAAAWGADKVHLESTLTSVEFYERQGFRRSGPQTTHPVQGVPVRCIPMERTTGIR